MVQVYVEPISRRHYAPYFSVAFLYRPFCISECRNISPRILAQTPIAHTSVDDAVSRPMNQSSLSLSHPARGGRALFLKMSPRFAGIPPLFSLFSDIADPSHSHTNPAVASLIIAFSIALTSGGLWVKTHTYVTQPSVRFKYDMLLVFETSRGPGTERVWSTFDSVNYLMGNKLAPVDISASEQDVNSDGKVDLIDIKAVVRGVGDVHGVKALMAFDYSLGGRVDLVMNSMAYASHSSPLAGSGLYVDGYLRLDQRDAIPAGFTRHDYNYSVFPFAEHGEAKGDTRDASTLRLPVVLNQYNFRNESTYLDAKTPVWESGNSPDFTFQARVRIPTSQQVLYRPTTLEIWKFAWVQILAIYIIFWWIFTKFEYVVFHHRIVDTRVVSDLQAKSHRF